MGIGVRIQRFEWEGSSSLSHVQAVDNRGLRARGLRLSGLGLIRELADAKWGGGERTVVRITIYFNLSSRASADEPWFEAFGDQDNCFQKQLCSKRGALSRMCPASNGTSLTTVPMAHYKKMQPLP